MKKSVKNLGRLMLVAFAALSISFAFASCGGEDNVYKNGGGEGAGISDGDGGNAVSEIGGGENEDGTVTLSIKTSMYVANWILTFDENDLCRRAICKCEFQTAKSAEIFYKGIKETYPSATKSGKIVTIDQTSVYVGLSKDKVIAAIEASREQ